MQNATYRELTPEEIAALEQNDCRASDWSGVQVADGFDPSRVAECRFQGQVRIGALAGSVTTPEGIEQDSGLYRARLRDVTVGNGCAISNINGWLSKLEIEDEVLIENVGTIACTGETSFGNGHEIEVLNEGGGRELKITKGTSAQAAYLTVLYRDRPDLVQALDTMADAFAASVTAEQATIGRGAKICNCTQIINVLIGPCATVSGAASLREGTIDSSADAPSVVGSGVVAEDFICQKGSSVIDGAMISASLVGEATRIGKQFSAENSVFFANSEGFHSEACSLFGGPYSVTHHRSTLLIAALTSFYNAGSGTNQSNHMYKLGPLHQGVLERGCKTGSFSYLLWPSRVGAFTAIMGKHYANFDTSDFPFSYIDEEKGKSTLIPGMNFFTVGTLRDADKWPARDRRTGADKLDLIIFDVLSPYTGQKMIRGSAILADLYEQSEKKQEFVKYNGIQIKRLLLKTCRRYYKLALEKYLGDVLLKRLEEKNPATIGDVLVPDAEGEKPGSEWVDVCGLLCSRARLETVASGIESGKVQSLAALQSALVAVRDAYTADEWNWFLGAYKEVVGRDIADETTDGLQSFLDSWKNASLKLINMVLNDAQKEFEGATRTGFGIDGDADADFESVRGTFDGNKFVMKLKGDIETINERYERAVKLIQ
jgi:Ni2+-binding GTPase involved in maturation of urease and hydrogenase